MSTSTAAGQLFDPEVRIDPASSSARFLIEHTEGKWHILDAAAGNGCDSVMLFRHGHRVTCNEIHPEASMEAKQLADRIGADLELTSFRWEHLDELLPPETTFDAILVTRNAFSLAEPHEQEKAIAAFVNRLTPGGVLIIDERNPHHGPFENDQYAPSTHGSGHLLKMLHDGGFEHISLYADLQSLGTNISEMPDLSSSDATLLTYVAKK